MSVVKKGCNMTGSTTRYRAWVPPLIIAVFIVGSARAQSGANSRRGEQTAFAADTIPGEVRIKKPVDISNGALQVLRNTERARLCITAAAISTKEVLASWFVGSEIHLNGPDEVDLIVEPRDLSEKPSANRCLYGAHVMPFWVLREADGKFQLLLETDAAGLFVLDSRTKGYRDIKEVTGFIGTTGSVTFQFDGEKYQISERVDKSN